MLKDIQKTTIQVTSQLRDALMDLGKKGESYESIIWRLINQGKPKK
ncbi:MAG TPA: hypothetical protein VMS35_06560 [Nitrososphaeraceae archaeon]|nr:hypothetical protein [Nitrososphaeraceae archaeon]